MTSVMQRPRSAKTNDLHYHDESRTHNRSTSSSHGQNHLISGEFSPSASTLGTSELGDQLADLQRELLGQTSMAGASGSMSSLQMAGPSDLSILGASGGVGVGSSGGMMSGVGIGNMNEVVNFGGLEGDGPSSSRIGLLDDPAVLALVGQSSNMESTDFELNIAAQALSSQAVEEVPGPFSDLDLTSAGTFQFPELPASLLDQAPEYEYSVHTQANVFDAVQDYDAAGEEEAARIFNLDHYDPALLEAPNTSIGGEDFWGYQSGLGTGGFGQVGMNDYATFQDSSSVSEYPDPSTAPTSRASEYKQDPMAGGFYSSNLTNSFNTPVNYPVKRRRESFDVSLAPSHDNMQQQQMGTTYGRPLEQQQQQQQQQFYPPMQPGVNYSHFDDRQHPVVPSQGVAARSRMGSWTGEGVHYVDDWPPPPAPAPMVGHRQGGQVMYQHDMTAIQSNVSQGFAVTNVAPNLPSGTNMMNNAMGARVNSTSSDTSGGNATGGQSNSNDRSNSPSSAAAAARNASQNEMINALGNAMDASMESEGVAKCPYPNCTKTFAKNRSYNLKAHLRSHSQLKPFACNHCPRAFSRKHDLERHARVHSGDKPYLCEACGKGFPRSDALRRHWRVEKECGDKAVEIEAGQPLPSLPPGVNTVAAQAKAPMPGMMQLSGPATTSMSLQSHPMNSFNPYPQQQQQNWEANNSYSYQQPDRKRAREDF